MINGLHIGNFKAFGPTQHIPLRPLTLIFGPNSSGKSSIIHSLLFGHEAMTGDEPFSLDVKRPRIGGDSVDLGGFRQFVHRRELSNQVEWGMEFECSELGGRLTELLASVKNVSTFVTVGIAQQQRTASVRISGTGEETEVPSDVEPVSAPRVESYRIVTPAGVLLRASLKGSGPRLRMGVDALDLDNVVLRKAIEAMVLMGTTTGTIQENDYAAIRRAVDEFIPSMSLTGRAMFPNALLWPRADDATTQHQLFPISKGARQDDLVNAVLFYLPRVLNEIVEGLEKQIRNTFARTKYLGPLRSYPPRHIAFAQYHDPNWQAGGGYAWDQIRADPDLRTRVNEWLGSSERMKTPYQIVVRDLLSLEALRGPVGELLYDYSVVERSVIYRDFAEVLKSTMKEADWRPILHQILERHQDVEETPVPRPYVKSTGYSDFDGNHERFADAAAAGLDRIYDLVLIDTRTSTHVSHRDVGIGVSQVLPVLVQCFGFEGALLATEQPELHLHPGLQAELGDVFIDSALRNGNTCLVETHSEHLILRILRRIREASQGKAEGRPKITPDDVALVFVQPTRGGSQILHLRIDAHGRLIDPCPGGFFEEDFAELF